jgi:hypothetical protein
MAFYASGFSGAVPADAVIEILLAMLVIIGLPEEEQPLSLNW